MSKQDVIDYVLNSPHNTNPAVLRSMMSSLGGGEPVILYPNSADYYLEDPTMGEIVLDAIKTGKQILVRVPNADDKGYTAIYSPILMYQLPNYANEFLYLFFLEDGKQDLSSIVPGMQLPTYGELKMKVAKEYYMSPLEKNRIPLVEKAKATLIGAEMATAGYKINYTMMSFDFNKTYLVVLETNQGLISGYGTVETYDSLVMNLKSEGGHYRFNKNGNIDTTGAPTIQTVSIYEIINQ